MIRVCVWWENQNCNESMMGLYCSVPELVLNLWERRQGAGEVVNNLLKDDVKLSDTESIWKGVVQLLVSGLKHWGGLWDSHTERERERARKIGLERALFKGGNGEVWGFCVFFVAEKEDEREREEELKFGVIRGCLYRWQIWCWGPCVVMSFIGGWCIANLSLDMKYELCCYVCWFT